MTSAEYIAAAKIAWKAYCRAVEIRKQRQKRKADGKYAKQTAAIKAAKDERGIP